MDGELKMAVAAAVYSDFSNEALVNLRAWAARVGIKSKPAASPSGAVFAYGRYWVFRDIRVAAQHCGSLQEIASRAMLHTKEPPEGIQVFPSINSLREHLC